MSQFRLVIRNSENFVEIQPLTSRGQSTMYVQGAGAKEAKETRGRGGGRGARRMWLLRNPQTRKALICPTVTYKFGSLLVRI